MAVEYHHRENPRHGTMTKEGLIVGRGDNRTVIDPEEVEKLARLWCSWEEMSDFFGVPANTLKYNFSDVVAKGRAETKQGLRKAQIKLALSGNATMLIWLGKNILNQQDSPQAAQSEALPFTDDELDDIKDVIEDELKDLDEIKE